MNVQWGMVLVIHQGFAKGWNHYIQTDIHRNTPTVLPTLPQTGKHTPLLCPGMCDPFPPSGGFDVPLLS